MSRYSGLEQHVISLFNNCDSLIWKGREYKDIRAFKPTTSSGECKTDTYVSLIHEDQEIDSIKISIKKDDAEFMGNKLTAVDAESLLGLNWNSILRQSIDSIHAKFISKEIFYLKPKINSTDIFFTLGWKLEIANKSRTLSTPLALSNREIVNKVFKGTEQPEYRKHAFVGGCIVANSGVADYLLEGNDSSFVNIQSVFNSLIDLSTYSPPDIHLIFTANNYRIMANKADGPRTLAVSVVWEKVGEKIRPRLIFDQPLAYRGESDMMPIIKNSLESIGIPKDTYLNESIDIEMLFETIKSSLILDQ